jgi:ABC-type polysaccharide/polyol phosphate transport system ATPase subunit
VVEPVIRLNRLSKKYPVYKSPSHKLLELLTLRRVGFHKEFWALSDIDLEVSPGTTLGVIGQNGSGKSTLLQILAGILTQTTGDCYVNGSVAALLELGAGFNPEFSGKENVYMNGAILGFTRAEMQRRMDNILEFAEIGDFIDQPVKTYSSGMFMRLAFSVAIHVDPEILLVDEALAVGDMVFQHRCTNRMQQLRSEGKTIVFVTHDLQAVTRFCNRAILLDGGEKLQDGEPEQVAQKYQALIFERERRRIGAEERVAVAELDEDLPEVRTIPYIHNRYGDGGAEILGLILLGEDGAVLNSISAGQKVRLLITAEFKESAANPIIGFTVRDRLGVDITSSNTSYEGLELPDAGEGDIVTVAFDMEIPNLRPGSYSISPAVSRGSIWDHAVEDWIDNAYIVDIQDTGLVYGQMRWPVEAGYRRSAGSNR